MPVSVNVNFLGSALRDSQKVVLSVPPQVGDWIFLDDNADGTICEVVKVVHLAGKSTGDVDVIVDLVGPFDTVNDVLGYARHRDSLVSDCVRSLVSQKLAVEG